jgi:hypothetical protein
MRYRLSLNKPGAIPEIRQDGLGSRASFDPTTCADGFRGQQALARSAMTEAVALLRKGLDVLAGLPDGPWRREQELDLQIALSQALTATRGWSAAEVGETLVRARVLAEQIDRPECLAPLIDGQFTFHCVRSEHKLALSLAEQIEKIGEVRNGMARNWLPSRSPSTRPASRRNPVGRPSSSRNASSRRTPSIC